MKALVYQGPWKMTVEDLPNPEPKEGELLLEMELVVDAVGSKKSFAQAVAMVTERGTVLFIGNLAKAVNLPLQTAVSNEVTFIGTYGFDKQAIEDAVQFVRKIKYELATFIERHCRVEAAPQIITRLANGELKALKVLIDF